MTQQYQDADSYMPGAKKEKLSFKDIILGHVKTIGSHSSVEFRGGFYLSVLTKAGDERQIYIPDTRETFSNSVIYLHSLLHAHFDKEMTKVSNEFIKRKREYEDEFMKKSTVEESVILGDVYYKTDGDKILLEEFRQRKLKLCIILFRQLCDFLYRKKYLEVLPIED